jgi:hypothetical protein
MLVKALVFAIAVASTPVALVVTQDPRPAPTAADPARQLEQRLQDADRQARQGAVDLAAARCELAAARQELATLRQQLEDSLDALDHTYEPQRERNCSPSRSRALMSHYQWLRGHGHAGRATDALAKIVDQIGDDAHRLNGAAWSLMTDDETSGKFDEVALAIADRMERSGGLEPRLLDTVALARFLNGQIDRAVALQRQAIDDGARGDDFRRRLRTFEAAQAAMAKAAAQMAVPAATLVAANDD